MAEQLANAKKECQDKKLEISETRRQVISELIFKFDNIIEKREEIKV